MMDLEWIPPKKIEAPTLHDLMAPEATVVKLAGDMKFTEGPVWLPKEKKLVFSDVSRGKLLEWSETDGLKLFRKSPNPNGNLLDREGRLIIIALLGGASSQIDLSLIMAKHLTVTGSRLRHRKPEEKRRIARALQKEVWPLLETGKIKPIIQATYPLEEAHKAHSIMDSDGTMGKLVLLTDS